MPRHCAVFASINSFAKAVQKSNIATIRSKTRRPLAKENDRRRRENAPSIRPRSMAVARCPMRCRSIQLQPHALGSHRGPAMRGGSRRRRNVRSPSSRQLRQGLQKRGARIEQKIQFLRATASDPRFAWILVPIDDLLQGHGVNIDL